MKRDKLYYICGIKQNIKYKGMRKLAYLLNLCKGKLFSSSDNNTQTASEPLAPVLKGVKYGYINKEGQIVISPQFDSANSFSK